ncbi:hypothetical protein KR032_005702 [Drosophila birchii]|nr:hypothetical protein KR032_005702 [Drosophila birchii]
MEIITRVLLFLLLLSLAPGSRTASTNRATLNYLFQLRDTRADPCENFQKFSSGKFMSAHKNDSVYDLEGSISHQMNIKMHKVLDNLRDRVIVGESSVEEKVWRFYDACLRAPKETQSWRHFLELIPPGKDLTWPVFTPRGSEWPKEKFDWLKTLARLRRLGVENLLIRMEVSTMYKDLSQFQLSLQRPEMNRIPSAEATRNILLSLGSSEMKAADLAHNISALDEDLLELPGEEYYVKYRTIEEFEKKTQIALSKYLEIVFGSAIDTSLTMRVEEWEYMNKLQLVMEKYDKEVVASYLMVEFLRFLRNLPGSKAEGNPFDCTTAVRTHFPLASEWLYKNFYFQQGREQQYDRKVQKLFQNLRETLSARLDQNRLNMKPRRVLFLKEKLRTMTVRLGELPNVPDQQSFVNAHYSDLLVDPVLDLARIQLKALEHQAGRMLRQLDRPIPKGNNFYMLYNEIGPLYSTPVFHISGNVIIVPYDILQDPFFSPNQHDVFQVSLLGYMLAYQMLETLKPNNLEYDKELQVNSIMRNFKRNLALLESMACFNQTQVPDVLELLYDVDALRLTYEAYFGEKSKFNRSKPKFTDLSLKKLFLHNFAQTFMGREEDIIYRGNSEMLRLHQSVSNLKAFGEVFKCPDSATLNPPIKCQLW